MLIMERRGGKAFQGCACSGRRKLCNPTLPANNQEPSMNQIIYIIGAIVIVIALLSFVGLR